MYSILQNNFFTHLNFKFVLKNHQWTSIILQLCAIAHMLHMTSHEQVTDMDSATDTCIPYTATIKVVHAVTDNNTEMDTYSTEDMFTDIATDTRTWARQRKRTWTKITRGWGLGGFDPLEQGSNLSGKVPK